MKCAALELATAPEVQSALIMADAPNFVHALIMIAQDSVLDAAVHEYLQKCLPTSVIASALDKAERIEVIASLMSAKQIRLLKQRAVRVDKEFLSVLKRRAVKMCSDVLWDNGKAAHYYAAEMRERMC
ncbi:hypothetical protein Q1695_006869 [Nippostrongylus brasiliensis]|nr:hypothetical protein Q1695_006869 [Nippostrongylus brasiliensis]